MDVAVDVGDVQQFLEVVGRDVAFFFQAAYGRSLVGGHSLGGVVLVFAGFSGKGLF